MLRRVVLLVVSAWAATAGPGAARPARADIPVRVMAKGARVADWSYGINERLGRAWLVLLFADRSFNAQDGPTTSDPMPTLVPGLTYRPEARAIIFEEPGQVPVECAHLVTRRFLFFHWTSVQPTGRCRLTRVEDEVVTTDTGFDRVPIVRSVIYFGRAR